MPQDSMPDWWTSRETASVVHTHLFYQVCKVHDIVYLGDQSAKAEKSWHLSFQHFSQKLVSCIIHNREWPLAQRLHKRITCYASQVHSWNTVKFVKSHYAKQPRSQFNIIYCSKHLKIRLSEMCVFAPFEFWVIKLCFWVIFFVLKVCF